MEPMVEEGSAFVNGSGFFLGGVRLVGTDELLVAGFLAAFLAR